MDGGKSPWRSAQLDFEPPSHRSLTLECGRVSSRPQMAGLMLQAWQLDGERVAEFVPTLRKRVCQSRTRPHASDEHFRRLSSASSAGHASVHCPV